METVSRFTDVISDVNNTNVEQADENVKRQLDELMADYATEDHCVMIGNRMYGFFSAQFQSKILGDATELYLDHQKPGYQACSM